MNTVVHQQFRRFIVGLLLFFTACILINMWVDPNRILPFTLGQHEHYYTNGSRMEKAARLNDQQFDTIILGSSRVQVGLNPSHQAFAGSKTYNLAMSAIDVVEYDKLLNYVKSHQDIKRLYLGLDFDSFAKPVPEPARLAFRKNYKRSLFNGVFDYSLYVIEYLLGFKTLFYSMMNIFSADYSKTNVYSDKYGFLDKSIIQTNHREIFRSEMNSRYTRAVFSAYDYDKSAEDILERQLLSLVKDGIQVTLFIPPVHGLMFEILDKLELYEILEQWKHNLVDLVARVENNTGESITLWDFNGNTRISMEPIPSLKASNQKMQYFYEFSHFKQSVGDMMIETMLGEESPSIGTAINTENIEPHLHKMRNARTEFRQRFPAELKEIDRLYQSTLCKRALVRLRYGKNPKLKPQEDSLGHCPDLSE